ncbi:MAG: DNA-directed RNA polymerase subunit omega, partial [Desulfatiglandales bacterium]
MARVTVEDSLKHIANRFLLVHATTRRARQLTKGSSPLVTGYRNREIVMALREMAAGKISIIKKVRASKGRSEKKAKTIELKP